MFKKFVSILIVVLFLTTAAQTFSSQSLISNSNSKTSVDKQMLKVPTDDGSEITLVHYNGSKKPSIILIPGYSCNYKIYDMDENHSLARFLNKNGWDTWVISLRTHDGDGDFIFDPDSNREKLCRYWDFDRTYLKHDLVTGVNYVKNISNCEKVFLMGHSMGGYLCYAYPQLIGEEDLAGIVPIGSTPFCNPRNFSIIMMLRYGIKIGKRSFVNPIGLGRVHVSKRRLRIIADKSDPNYELFYKNTTSKDIQYKFHFNNDDEPAGVYVDMIWGRDPRFYDGHWVDPQTLYDYSENLDKITVPFFAVAGDQDRLQDPKEGMYKGYQRVSSEEKQFMSVANYSHCDLLLGDNADEDIFVHIVNWIESFS